MRIIVKPAKRAGIPKTIFESELSGEELDSFNCSGVVISVTADPIYKKKRFEIASQYRYDIMFSAEEISTIASAIRREAME